MGEQIQLVSSVEEKVDQLMIQIQQEKKDTREILFSDFIQTFQQNNKLIKQNIDLQNQLTSVQEELDILTKQLEKKLEEEHLIEEKRLRRKN